MNIAVKKKKISGSIQEREQTAILMLEHGIHPSVANQILFLKKGTSEEIMKAGKANHDFSNVPEKRFSGQSMTTLLHLYAHVGDPFVMSRSYPDGIKKLFEHQVHLYDGMKLRDRMAETLGNILRVPDMMAVIESAYRLKLAKTKIGLPAGTEPWIVAMLGDVYPKEIGFSRNEVPEKLAAAHFKKWLAELRADPGKKFPAKSFFWNAEKTHVAHFMVTSITERYAGLPSPSFTEDRMVKIRERALNLFPEQGKKYYQRSFEFYYRNGMDAAALGNISLQEDASTMTIEMWISKCQNEVRSLVNPWIKELLTPLRMKKPKPFPKEK